MTFSGIRSLSRNEAKLLLRFQGTFKYFLHEVAGDKNDYKYVRSLSEKGLLEIETSPSYLPLQSGTQQPSLNLVRLAAPGSRLRDAISQLNLVERQQKKNNVSIRVNEFLVLLRLARHDAASERDLALACGLSTTAVRVSLARLRALGLIARHELRCLGDGRILADAVKSSRNGVAIPTTDASDRDLRTAPDSRDDSPRRNLFEDVVRCRTILQRLVGLDEGKPSETVLILGDTTTHHVATLFAIACDMLGVEHTFMVMPPQSEMGRLPQLIGAAIEKTNVLLAFTRESITYSQAVRRRLDQTHGAFRCVDLYQPKLAWLSESIITDPLKLEEIQHDSDAIAETLSCWKRIKIVSSSGTDLVLTRNTKVGVQLGRCFNMNSAEVRFPKANPNTTLFAGEVFFEAVDAEGSISFDGPCNLFPGRETVPFQVQIEDTRIVKIDGRKDIVHRIVEFFKEHPENRELTSVCVGTNKYLAVTGDYLPDCKVRGNVNIGFGSNTFVKGRRDSSTLLSAIVRQSEINDDDGDARIICDGTRSRLSVSKTTPVYQESADLSSVNGNGAKSFR